MRLNTAELKAHRIRKGLTIEKMAEKLNMAVSTYGLKERGRYAFNSKELVRVAEVLTLSMRDVNTIWFDGKLC